MSNGKLDWLTCHDSCRYSGMDEEMLIRLANKGIIRRINAAGKIRYNRHDLDAAVTNCSRDPESLGTQNISVTGPVNKRWTSDMTGDRNEFILNKKSEK